MAMEPAPHAVGALIDSVMEVNEWTLDHLGERSRSIGGPGRSTISRWRSRPIVTVSGDQVRELASILGVPVERVVRAYLTALGLPATAEPSGDAVEAAIRADGRLSADDHENLIALVKAMRSRRG